MVGGAVELVGSALVEGAWGLNLLVAVLPMGFPCLKILDLGRLKIKYLFVISLLKSAFPEELRSFSLGKAWKLSPSNRKEILPEWDSWLFLVHATRSALKLKMQKCCSARLQWHIGAV